MKHILSEKEKATLLSTLEKRFLDNQSRHPSIQWLKVLEKIKDNSQLLYSLSKMEETGGEPDIVGDDYVFVDCSIESPKGRRSMCYDQSALQTRRKNKPQNDAQSFAKEIGISILTVEDYQELQHYGEFDTSSSSWLETPDKIRKLGGALFGDRRYDTVFIYHNGAESYYANRGFRGKLKI